MMPYHLPPEQARKNRVPKVEEFLADPRTAALILRRCDREMAFLYTNALMRREGDQQGLHMMLYGGWHGDWFVRDGDEPDWGTGLRMDIPAGPLFVVWSIRRDCKSDRLRITAEVADTAGACTEVWRVEYSRRYGFELIEPGGQRPTRPLRHISLEQRRILLEAELEERLLSLVHDVIAGLVVSKVKTTA